MSQRAEAKICLVCKGTESEVGEIAVHYEADSCIACKSFFYRASKRLRMLGVAEADLCNSAVYLTKLKDGARFGVCVKAGMKPNLVLGRLKKGNRQAQRRYRLAMAGVAAGDGPAPASKPAKAPGGLSPRAGRPKQRRVVVKGPQASRTRKGRSTPAAGPIKAPNAPTKSTSSRKRPRKARARLEAEVSNPSPCKKPYGGSPGGSDPTDAEFDALLAAELASTPDVIPADLPSRVVGMSEAAFFGPGSWSAETLATATEVLRQRVLATAMARGGMGLGIPGLRAPNSLGFPVVGHGHGMTPTWTAPASRMGAGVGAGAGAGAGDIYAHMRLQTGFLQAAATPAPPRPTPALASSTWLGSEDIELDLMCDNLFGEPPSPEDGGLSELLPLL